VPARKLALLKKQVTITECPHILATLEACPDLILDDLLNEAYAAKCVICLRKKVTTVTCKFNKIFFIRKNIADISLNAKHFVLLKNVRYKIQLVFLARQVYRDNPELL
jgi:hypothetical protein